jgi:hypothetical protein
MSRTCTMCILGLASVLGAVAAFGQATRDHLTCFRITDSAPKTKYTASLTTAAGSQTCTVKTPAKLACVETQKSAVTPPPPGGGPTGSAAGSFLCYKTKCPKPTASSNVEDQFGKRVVSFGGAKVLCVPAVVAEPTPGVPTVTTTTVPGATGCRFTDGKCQGSCGGGMRCGAAVGTASCECRSVACGDADAPTCDGACAEAGEACIFSFTGCSCARIP